MVSLAESPKLKASQKLLESSLERVEMIAIIQDVLPIFFVMFLGYMAGKKHGFDQDQAAGFNKLVLDFALPTLLFSSIISSNRATLFSDATLFVVAFVALIIWYFVTFFIAMGLFGRNRHEAGLAGLSAGAPTVGFLGIAVLDPIFGTQAAVTVAIVSLVVNAIQVPLTIVLSSSIGTSPFKAIKHAFFQPIVYAPLAAVLLVLVEVDVPQVVGRMLALIGGTASGVAVFAAGLTLSAHKTQFSLEILWNVSGKLLLLPALTMALAIWAGISGVMLQELVLLAALPPAFSGVILASNSRTYVEPATSTLILSSLLFALTAPLWMFIASSYS